MRFAVRLVGLCAACALVAATPPDPLSVVAAASGHPVNVHIRATATRVIERRAVAITIEQFGTTRLVRRCIAEVCSGTWFDGRRLWRFGLNEVPFPDDADPSVPLRRTLAAVVSYAFAEPAFRAGGGSIAAVGSSGWQVRALDGATLVVQLDAATHALRRVLTDRGEVIASYGRETRVSGARFPLDREGLDEEPVQAATAVAGPLTAPAGAVPSFTGDGVLTLAADPIPIVPCTLAGRAARCLLDSGATPSAITLPFAEVLGLEPRGELEVAGFSRFATGFIETGPLAVGAARFEHARFAVVPNVAAAGFDVSVGADLLGRIRVVLDRGSQQARIVTPGGPAPAGAIALRFRNGVPLVETTIAGNTETALFDTGDASTLSLGYAEYRKGPQWPVVERGLALGVAGAADALLVDVPNARVGSIDLGRTRATVRRTQEMPHVGIGLWSRCVIDLDESQARLGCRPR